ncbi:MAG TPA: hypothetical protein VMU10_04310 [Desulfomonilia bacterium]|nr:hypothetical protein [Desulfomonilia bacterium]
MAGDEFFIRLQKARKAVEDYKREMPDEDHSPSERLKAQHIQMESHQHMIETKTIGAPCTVCPYCGGSGKL